MADAKPAGQSPAVPTKTRTAAAFSLPLIYRLFFLLIEPISALVGAYYAYFGQDEYLRLTHAASAPSPIPLGTSITMSQLANLYFFFAINEALVLRSTSDIRVWKTVLFCLVIADLGHLYTVRGLGPEIYWSFTKWNAIDWGNIPFVYLGATMRLAFLANIGLGKGRKLTKKEN
ncbi:hypothetical protein CONLIGDRAFT_163593 [Coniochaeta ligniaria NRRL 30616]|uniref:DUF7704 domain-containing protein n=1 Tax=Coniochaeta ligniaria NRRL 30616 TaxID=1408157 RepID=A0A1J7JT51_9PEZI|nr:hypothetical protein CONLIGDRAFT_163593 [Coniochaeta ligniaria NRRL 30616]